ncbi:nicotinate-nucleotide adenylyltransferase [Methylomonas rosea]|uniref:Probable nicotinate-nucleotide adenylyltransferase n=1 Tax=Methylomonas rosea TaxID=2952227 RepID=A0ABT1TW41_9GAMM|nr:nicotinate-nucleotide adenylyltransferase [Methylomonas sp. WSC-7]MCQ8118740.1 nicotinate-nucleotide adenylyltransferase [Methylomonas sp. WSC-7]
MIGVYGGTFNPVHYGHLRTALEVKELFELEQLRLIPCRLPPHRDEPDVPAHLRLQMLEAAVADTHGFNVDRRELDRAGPSYMVDTLHSLRAEIDNTPLLLFIGADAFAGLERWHQWQRLFDYAHIVVMTRPGYAGLALSAFLQQRIAEDRTQLSRQTAGLLTFQEVTALAISATAIRELVASGRDPQFLMPDRVIELIRRHHLYQPPTHHTGN